jgi:uncharacterized membrane protein
MVGGTSRLVNEYKHLPKSHPKALFSNDFTHLKHLKRTEMRTNLEILSDAWQSLKGQRGLALGTLLVYILIVGTLSFIDSSASLGLLSLVWTPSFDLTSNVGVLQVLWSGAFSLGSATFMLKIVRRANPDFEDIFSGFNQWKRATWTSIVYVVRLILWYLLLIIPGIIKSFAYAQTWFVLVDYPELSANQAINRSEEMMQGHKIKLFLLSLWILLLVLAGVLTLFIGFFWIGPWIAATSAQFYTEVKADWLRRNGNQAEPTPTEEAAGE